MPAGITFSTDPHNSIRRRNSGLRVSGFRPRRGANRAEPDRPGRTPAAGALRFGCRPSLWESAMTKITRRVVEFLKREDGPTAVEYAVMLALIIVVCIAAITALGSNASQTFSYVGSNVKPTGS